jgi:hypothetical protein
MERRRPVMNESVIDRGVLINYYPDLDFGSGVGVGGGVEGLVVFVHPERPHAVAVPEPLALRHVVRALHHEVAVGELHLLEPGGGVPATAAAAGTGRGQGMEERGHSHDKH